jgi:two-component system phosphate regulon sensor histidine kinase PhoR
MRGDGLFRIVVAGAAIAVASATPLVAAISVEPGAPKVIVLAAFLSSSIAIVAGLWLAFRNDDALGHIEAAASRFAKGDFDTLIVSSSQHRLAELSNGLNEMAMQLKSKLEALSQISSEQDAILRSMTEGVLTVDSSGRIRRVNQAASALLGIENGPVSSRLVSEVIQHPDIRGFIAEASASMSPKSGTVTLREDPEVILDVYGSPLFQYDLSSSGTLIVFRDMTRVHKLERVRRDFVANVSHELRTPITSIKGFTETLLDGAMHDSEALKRFLGIIGKHSERLHAIFNDLLTLARLEVGSEDDQVEFTQRKLVDLVREAIDACSDRALSKGAAIEGAISEDLVVFVNASLIQQALVNLIDNAIKYSDPGVRVTVSAERQGDFVRCMVADTGPGIESSHLARLFERFYRVDHGRSRQMGGTGLGLSIVKHIAQVHGGRVDVQSALGNGSIFSLVLRTRQ